MTSSDTKPLYHHGNVREAALAAAILRLRERGSEGLSLRAIASEIAVTHGALYHYFKNRDALLDAAGAVAFDQLADRLEKSCDRTDFIKAYVAFAMEEPHLYDLAMTRHHDAIQHDPEMSCAVRRVIGAGIKSLSNADLSEDERKSQVMRVWTMLHGALGLYRADILAPRSPEQFLDLAIELTDSRDAR